MGHLNLSLSHLFLSTCPLPAKIRKDASMCLEILGRPYSDKKALTVIAPVNQSPLTTTPAPRLGLCTLSPRTGGQPPPARGRGSHGSLGNEGPSCPAPRLVGRHVEKCFGCGSALGNLAQAPVSLAGLESGGIQGLPWPSGVGVRARVPSPALWLPACPPPARPPPAPPTPMGSQPEARSVYVSLT